MKNCLKISLCIVLFLSILFSFFMQNQRVEASTDHLMINEVYYDVAKNKGAEGTNEWVEIYNPTNLSFNLNGWSIGDLSKDKLIDGDYIIEPLGFAVITDDSSTWSFWSLPDKTVKIELKSPIGSGLNNSKDKISLKDQVKNSIDEVSYGGGAPDLPAVAEGHSLERAPAGGSEFVDQSLPTPGVGLPSITNLSFSDVTEGSVELIWTENLDTNFKKYLICVSDDDCTSPIQLIEDSRITNIQIGNLVSGVQYKIKIRVVNLEGGYLDSNVIIIITKKIYSKAIIVNEIFPAPHEPFLSSETGDEYIELYNSSDEEVDLSGWKLEDTKGATKTFIILPGTKIGPESYLVFSQKVTGITLNNDGDGIQLLWPDGGFCFGFQEYTKAEYNMSWSRNIDGNWVFTTTPTFGKANIFTSKQEEIQNFPTAPIEEAKMQPKNSWVKVSGIVTAIPGLFGKKVAYIQDESGGIKIYFDDALWPDLKIGDKVIILGKISTSSGEYQIKVYNSSDIVITEHISPPEPAEHKINEINELVGQLIKVSGKVTKISGSSVWLDDGTGIIRMYFYATTGIKGLDLEEGDWLEVVGILSKTSAGLRLLPRSKEDIKIIKQSKGEVKAAEDNNPVAQILGVEKAYAASDYRTDSQPAEIKKKLSYLWGGIVLVAGLLSLATLLFFARIREKYAKDNQFF